MDNTKTTAPAETPTQAPQNKVRVEVEYNLETTQLVMRQKAPTVVVMGILADAMAQVDTVAFADVPADGKILIGLDFDLATQELVMTASAPRVMILGLLQYAIATITQNQVLQRLQKLQAREALLKP